MDIWRRSVLGRGNGKYKGPVVGLCLLIDLGTQEGGLR